MKSLRSDRRIDPAHCRVGLLMRLPIIQAPLAGGPSTPELAAAVTGAGGLGFIAAGYLTAARVREQLDGLPRPYGLNLFVPPAGPPVDVSAYAAELGGELGEPRHDDDDWDAKLELALEVVPDVVSFTFGCPPVDVIGALRSAGAEVWVTVTTPEEAALAAAAGADAVVAQGVEAGGHRGSFDDGAPGEIGLLALLQLIDTPVRRIATGGLMTRAGIEAALAAGAEAAQLGTAFLLCPEAATVPAHRDALRRPGRTALTRAFSGRLARGIENRFMREHSGLSAYPEIHHLTSPLRAAARAAGDADGFNLWAGQGFALCRDRVPAADLVRELAP